MIKMKRYSKLCLREARITWSVWSEFNEVGWKLCPRSKYLGIRDKRKLGKEENEKAVVVERKYGIRNETETTS